MATEEKRVIEEDGWVGFLFRRIALSFLFVRGNDCCGRCSGACGCKLPSCVWERPSESAGEFGKAPPVEDFSTGDFLWVR